ncbi:hypothetical protein N866_10820 [Actinotalea ferrariae CF5-4]|uniref:Prepilin-type N-terminal cleavage/methylation domain-containing protein n=1 Tax=Actinotalea ferrariae CF5-4 TaxID=948458 RepID=A0A021VTG7_9CELL|nr:prepilin-type N-terminal cleavage/methylation domain-containing protein [Actinotalea ferrariae]EYR64451.1 hypothetical protein N866_10820 [Actinotalea ferrariae CF5-4]
MSRVGRPNSGRDSGLTLIELLVTMLLLGVVSTLVVTAVSQSVRVLTQTQDESTGLNDAKTVLDRVARDIRQARSVSCTPTAADPDLCFKSLTLWIDADSSYTQEADERVTWELQLNADGEHYDVWRIEGDPTDPLSPRQVQASSLIVDVLFKYFDEAGNEIQPADADIVNFTMQYDAILDRGTERREAAFSARLRNKG